jgi:maltose O-acetyltransferase
LQAKIGRWLRRALIRIRGSQNIESLVAAGLERGEGGMVLDRSYLDPTRPWLIKIGKQVGISSYVRMLTHDDRMRIQTGFTRIAPVEIGDRVFVGVGSTIVPGTRIGADSIVAAGSVVSGEVPPGSLVAGHPGRVVAPVTRLHAWQRRARANAPVWQMEGWTQGRGITDERKATQREALANVREGYAHPREAGGVAGTGRTRAEWAAAVSAIDLRGVRPRTLPHRLANQLRGNRSLERQLREGLQLGQRSFVADEAFLDPGRPWLITIGADSFISPHVIIFTHDSGLYYHGGLTRIGRVDIGDRVFVGPGALILPGVQIGNDSIIEAGAVVRTAIPPGSYVAGNPGAVVGEAASFVEGWRGAAEQSRAHETSSGSGLANERKRAGRGTLTSPSVDRLRRTALAKLRGERTLEQLVADGLELGKDASVARRAYLDPTNPSLITIGEESIVSDFAIIMTQDQRTKVLGGTPRVGRVVIGRRVFVGPRAIILPGTTIADDSVIDVQAVVSGEIPPGSFVSGNPGQIAGDVEAMAGEFSRAAARGPSWPDEGWSAGNGITVERERAQRAQRDALATASNGYVRAPARRLPQRT